MVVMEDSTKPAVFFELSRYAEVLKAGRVTVHESPLGGGMFLF